jgi:NAD-dependent SIR2 family protein deacetylase
VQRLRGNAVATYKATPPHAGYALLRKLLGEKDMFALTSNVDRALQKAGFAQVRAIHGETEDEHWQCASAKCTGNIFAIRDFDFGLDPETKTASKFPKCPECGNFAR